MHSPSDDQPFADLLTRARVSTSCCGMADGSGSPPAAWTLGPLLRPKACDLVLVEVIELGYAFGDGQLEVQGKDGVTATQPLEVGAIFVGALGDREADDEWTAELPAGFDGKNPTMDLAAGCGLISAVQRNYVSQPPTRVRVLGAVHSGGVPATTRPARMVRPDPDPSSTVILFVADKMNAGKSTAILACTRALAAAGHVVAVGKVTGTTRRRSMVSMVEAGARVAQSFCDFGYASTKNMAKDDLDRVLDCMVSGLSAEAAGGYVLLELADGFDQAETKAVLGQLAKHPIDKVALCLSGIGDPAHSKERFQAFCEAHRPPDYISGSITAQPDHLRALQGVPSAGAIPTFDAMNANPRELGRLLTTAAPHAD